MFMMLALLSASVTVAQTRAVKSRVAEIRKLYQQAKEDAKHIDDGEGPRSDMEVTANYMVPACGLTTETLHYYYELQQDGEDYSPFYQPYLVTRKFNVAAREYFQEFLYDRDRRTLIFAYTCEVGYDGGKNESRYYWDFDEAGANVLCHKILSGKPEITAEEVLKKSRDLADGLNFLLNQ